MPVKVKVRRTITALAALGVVALPSGPALGLTPPADAPPQGENLAHQIIKVVENGRNRIVTVGGFHPDSRASDPDPTTEAAVGRYGQPTTVERDGAGCRFRWTRIGVTIDFANFGGSNACTQGRAQVIDVRGEAARGFHTNRDLYITSSLDRLRQLYPEQDNGRGEWSLLRQYRPIGPDPIQDLLTAQVTNGKVSSFTVYPYAAGD